MFQGKYNIFQRAVEPELIPCLREYGIRFYAFNPIASGFLAGGESRNYSGNKAYGDAVQIVEPVLEKFGIGMRECGLRWLKWHSLLSAEKGDAILMGASSAVHLESNLVDLEKGGLPEEVVEVVQKAWEMLRGPSWKYLL